MLVVRNVFHLKFGKTKEAVALAKEMVEAQKRLGVPHTQRILTDLTGPFYTLVLELTVPDLATLESTMPKVMGNSDFQARYRKFVELVDNGYREIFTICE